MNAGKRETYRLLCALLPAGGGIGPLTAATTSNRRCEYLVNPLGMEVANPRFTRQLDDDTSNRNISLHIV
ncbi:MAG: hypothetical protein LBB90_06300 [Tannerella sp.]|nr:hypothetical protein [Tannerella sp.]